MEAGIANILPEQVWTVVVGFLVAFVLAFGIGANDVANSFGTSVGSRVLTLKQACILATTCEMSGAILLGAKVSNTIRKGIVDITLYDDLPNGVSLLMIGQVAALSGSCIWLLIATLLRLPVSGTHSIVGATIGFSLVTFGASAVHWAEVGKIVASWFLSPALSGLTSVLVFFLMKRLVLRKEERLEPSLRMLPGFYGIVVLVNSVSIFYGGPPVLHFDKIPIYGVAILSCGLGCLTVLMVKFLIIPRMRRNILYGTDKEVPVWRRRMMNRVSGLCHCRLWSKNKRDLTTHDSTDAGLEKADKTDPSTGTDDCLAHLEDGQSPEVSFVMSNSQAKRNGSVNIEMKSTQRGKSGGVGGKTMGAETIANDDDGGAASVPAAPDGARVRPLHAVPLFPGVPQESQMQMPRVFEVKPSSTSTESGKADKDAKAVVHTFAINHPASNSSTEAGGVSGAGTIGLSMKSSNLLPAAPMPTIGEEEVDARETHKGHFAEERVFASLQIVTAIFGSFAHGGNDVSNAIGPLIGLWIVAITQAVDSKLATPIWLLFYGGFGISVGLWIWGRRVIKTLGDDLTDITPSTGVCIEIGSAMTVLVASKFGLPISTTHCKVGSVVCVGRARSKDSVNWAIFRNISIAWMVTLPVTGGISALIMYLLSFTV